MIFQQQHCRNCNQIEEHELVEIVGLSWLECTVCLESTPLGEREVSRYQHKERTMKKYNVTMRLKANVTVIVIEAKGVCAAINEVRARFGTAVEIMKVDLCTP